MLQFKLLQRRINIFAIIIILLPSFVSAAPKSILLKFWEPQLESSTQQVDNTKWQLILDRYLIANHENGINRFDYKRVSNDDKKILQNYLKQMQALDPRQLNRNVQKSYWINLYNALTVNLVLESFPTKSITKIGKGFFSFGPWDDDVAVIQGQHLTLNNIEHGILRPIWKDNRIHYAVNCASMGCPNLSKKAYNEFNTNSILDEAAHDYVNHSRAVMFKENALVLSKIYEWYINDFGGNDQSLLTHLKSYANSDLKQKLSTFKGKINYDYDWSLNIP